MLTFFRDQLTTLQLRARYQRVIQERLLELTESRSLLPVSDDAGGWQLLGRKSPGSSERESVRERVRKLVRDNPHACNILRLMEVYVTGPGLAFSHQSVEEDPAEAAGNLAIADRLWKEFLRCNCRHYSFEEHARRTWRDGECFVRKFDSRVWPPHVRFVDPELIAASPEAPDSQGILTDGRDMETPIAYQKVSLADGLPMERIPAEEMFHSRRGADTNEKRGCSILAAVVDPLDCYEKWLETEMLARKLQSSIVLWRKVQGSPQLVDGLADQSATGPDFGRGRRERFGPGTILTTNHGTEIQFLQPNTNFGDAVPLGRMLLLSIAAGAGLPEFMLTADASNANFASTMVAEGPAVKFFQSEQQFFSGEFRRLWRWVMETAIDRGLLPIDFFETVDLRWTFPSLINRDRPQERLADVRLIESGVLSRAEVARRDGVDPRMMRAERDQEGLSAAAVTS